MGLGKSKRRIWTRRSRSTVLWLSSISQMPQIIPSQNCVTCWQILFLVLRLPHFTRTQVHIQNPTSRSRSGRRVNLRETHPRASQSSNMKFLSREESRPWRRKRPKIPLDSTVRAVAGRRSPEAPRRWHQRSLKRRAPRARRKRLCRRGGIQARSSRRVRTWGFKTLHLRCSKLNQRNKLPWNLKDFRLFL